MRNGKLEGGKVKRQTRRWYCRRETRTARRQGAAVSEMQEILLNSREVCDRKHMGGEGEWGMATLDGENAESR